MKVELYQTNHKKIIFSGFNDKLMEDDCFDLNRFGYKKVLELDYYPQSETRLKQLEELFCYLNADERPKQKEIRSMSVSDVIILEHKAYYCDYYGFKAVNLKQQLKERGDSYRSR